MLSVNAHRAFEQQQLLDTLRGYNPWGRAGGGAPTGDTRRRDLTSRHIYPQYPPMWRDVKERVRPPLRPKHRPHLSFQNAEILKNDYPMMPIENIMNYRERGRSLQNINENNFVRMNNVNTLQNPRNSDPWSGRGPWGKRGPGGFPWRAAGDVGKNFHHSMGWTTENTFHFPSIAVGRKCRRCSDRENINFYSKGFDKYGDRMPPIRRNSVDKAPKVISDYELALKKYHSGHECGQWKAGGTPTKQLLQMTGGIELVPLMRARAWTHKPKSTDLENVQGIFQREPRQI